MTSFPPVPQPSTSPNTVQLPLRSPLFCRFSPPSAFSTLCPYFAVSNPTYIFVFWVVSSCIFPTPSTLITIFSPRVARSCRLKNELRWSTDKRLRNLEKSCVNNPPQEQIPLYRAHLWSSSQFGLRSYLASPFLLLVSPFSSSVTDSVLISTSARRILPPFG